MVTAAGAVLGESIAIVGYVCRHLELDTAPSDEDFAQSENLLEKTSEVYLALNKARYSPGGRSEAMDDLFEPGGVVRKLLASLDSRVGPAGWLGPQGVPTAGDLALCAALHILASLQPDFLDAHPRVKPRHDAVHAMESIAHVNRTYPALSTTCGPPMDPERKRGLVEPGTGRRVPHLRRCLSLSTSTSGGRPPCVSLPAKLFHAFIDGGGGGGGLPCSRPVSLASAQPVPGTPPEGGCPRCFSARTMPR